jgi:hypothetical protein
MKDYLVKIDERMTHNLRIEAASPEAALEKAYELLRDGMSPEDEKACDYSMESDGFTGEHEVDLW